MVNSSCVLIMSSPISILQEYAVKHFIILPQYTWEFDSCFICHCKFNNYVGSCAAPSKKDAKHGAALNVLKFFGLDASSRNTTQLVLDSTSNNSLAISLNSSKPVLNISIPELTTSTPALTSLNTSNGRNAVSIVHEYCQAKMKRFPNFTDEGSLNGSFVFKCCIDEHEVTGYGRTKKDAKRNSCEKMLDILQIPFSTSADRDITPNESPQLISSSTSSDLNVSNASENAISLLHEYCQSRFLALPVYHDQGCRNDNFIIRCCIVKCNENIEVEGCAKNKQGARKDASAKMLKMLKGDDDCFNNSFEIETKRPRKDTEKAIILLNDYCSKNNFDLPEYFEEKPFNEVYEVRCVLKTLMTRGFGPSYKAAKLQSVDKMLDILPVSDSTVSDAKVVEVYKELTKCDINDSNDYTLSLNMDYLKRRFKKVLDYGKFDSDPSFFIDNINNHFQSEDSATGRDADSVLDNILRQYSTEKK